ncbi:MAG: hypothetical protein KatS3mg112_0818 [Thermogutta sp.]|nr:MAG: hypothetical protein KatS3mg112_0818 [Thermogutta sp.]
MMPKSCHRRAMIHLLSPSETEFLGGNALEWPGLLVFSSLADAFYQTGLSMAKGIFSFLIVDLPTVAGGSADDQNSESFWMVTANPGRNRMSAGKQEIPHEENEINRWARLAKDGTPEEREEAWKRLIPFISGMAHKIGRSLGFRKDELDKLAEDAPGSILEKLGAYDPTRSFKAWLTTVLRNWMCDCKRQEKRRERHERRLSDVLGWRDDDFENARTPATAEAQILADSHSAEDYLQIESTINLTTPLPGEDLETLERGLNPWPRVVAVVIVGLWVCVPKPKRDSWLAEAELPPDFPPAEVTQQEDYNSRVKSLASLLGTTEASLRMVLSRARPVLQSLKRIQDLRDG